MESVFWKKDVQKISRQQEEIIELELPKLEYSELKKLENRLFKAGARYVKWEIQANESKDGKAHKGKRWYIYKTDDTDMTPFMDYIKKNDQNIEQPLIKKIKKKSRKTSKEYEKARHRKIQVKIRTTEEEYRILKEKAEFCNLSLTQYLLKIGIEGFIVIQDLKTLSELANEIYKVGVNINQIARKVNTSNVVMDKDMEIIKSKMNDIKDMMHEVIDKNILK